jgi:hypothetical protein
MTTMLQHFALLIALTAAGAQDAPLEIANAHGTYGYLGAPHPTSQARLPGDIIYFTFDIKNLKLDSAGRASYSLLVEVTDDKGGLVYKVGPTNAVAQNYLGGNSMPCSAHLEIPGDNAPGMHNLKITITDRATNKSVFFERTGKVLPPDFGLVRVATYADRESKVPAAPVGVIGTAMYFSFAPTGFARDQKTGQPNLHVSMRVLDDKGQPTFAQPLSGDVNKEVPADLKIIPMNFGITLTRLGQFTVELEATDKITGKSAKVTLPLRVVSLK